MYQPNWLMIVQTIMIKSISETGRVKTGMHAEMFDGDHDKTDELVYADYECLLPNDVADAVHWACESGLCRWPPGLRSQRAA